LFVRPDYVKVVAGEGMPISKTGGESRGHLKLKFKIQFPTFFDEETKKIIRKNIP
jgi:DnaJ-class molecular chaperone